VSEPLVEHLGSSLIEEESIGLWNPIGGFQGCGRGFDVVRIGKAFQRILEESARSASDGGGGSGEKGSLDLLA